MSWSVNFIGTPDNIVKALEAESARLTDKSKEEFDAALPNLSALVKQNSAATPPILKLNASGHAYHANGSEYKSCSAHIEPLGATMV